MGYNTQSIEVTSEETGEVWMMDPSFLVGHIRDYFLSMRRQQVQATVWDELSEEDQKSEISRAGQVARDVIEKVVEAVAVQEKICAHVEVAKFAVDVKSGEITITAKGRADDESLLDLNHSRGRVCVMTVVDVERFSGMKAVPVNEDQPTMFGATDTENVDREDAYKEAVALVLRDRKASTSYIQRKMSCSYNLAAGFIERMEEDEILSKPDDVGKREILIAVTEEENEDIAAAMDASLDSMDDGDDLHAEGDDMGGHAPDAEQQEQMAAEQDQAPVDDGTKEAEAKAKKKSSKKSSKKKRSGNR